MSVKLVMGAQRDSLEKLEKFGGEDGGVIFPHFRQDLENALRFELGEVGVMILRNQFPMNTMYDSIKGNFEKLSSGGVKLFDSEEMTVTPEITAHSVIPLHLARVQHCH